MVKHINYFLRILLVCLFSLVLPLAASASSTVTYIHTDTTGNAVAATDSNGQLLWKESYYPYGDRIKRGGDATNKIWFHGKPQNAATGLSYFGARYYDAVLGRFMGMDPVGVDEDNLHSFNRYAYGNNNPYRFIDPDGEQPQRAESYRRGPPNWSGVNSNGLPNFSAYMGMGRYRPSASRTTPPQATAATKTYQTYTKVNPETGKVYTGRTSGVGTPRENVANRDAGHHMNAEGYGPARLDKSSSNRDAIRGREQELIDANGGAQSMGGTSGNKINGVSPTNPKASHYQEESKKEFGGQ